MNKVNINHNNCKFCNNLESVIYETKNFYVKVGKAIITAGHVMIIPKFHYSCIADIDKSLYNEYLKLKEYVIKKITSTFSKPFLIECGIFAQSVFHAHIHLIPTSSELYSYVDPMVDFLEHDRKILDTEIVPIKDFQDLVNYFNKYKQYLYYEIDNKQCVLKVDDTMKDREHHLVGYRAYFSKVLKLKGVKSWKEMTEEDIKNDNIKIETTKKKLIL